MHEHRYAFAEMGSKKNEQKYETGKIRFVKV
jgi:hypothetical protein